jgi:hypothetical protein
LLILFAMAVGCALLASLTLKDDMAVSFGAVPLFIGACLLGMRRNGQLSRRD